MSYDQPSREALEESLGYDRFVLKRAVRVQSEYYGIDDPTRMIINDEPPHEHVHGSSCFFSAGPQLEVVRALSPLLFVSAFKVCDMVVEWILEENGRTPPRAFWSFAAKAKELQRGGLVYPDFFAPEPRLQHILTELFIRLRLKRNALIHGKWGHENEGDLVFDFHEQDDLAPGKPTVHVQETITFHNLLHFADWAAMLADLLVTPSTQSVDSIETFKWQSDRIARLHRAGSFGIQLPRLFKVVRRTSGDSVDLAEIRTHIEQQTQGAPYTFHLTVEHTPSGRTWETREADHIGQNSISLSSLS